MRNSTFNLVGGTARVLLTALAVVVLIRIMGLERYGLWVLASSVVSILSISEGGLSTAAVWFVSRDLAQGDDHSLSETLTFVLISSLFLAILAAMTVYILSPAIAHSLIASSPRDAASATTALQIGAIVVASRTLAQVLNGVLQAKGRYGTISALITAQAAGTSIGLMVVASRGGGVVELMVLQAGVALASVGIYAALVSHSLRKARIRPSIGQQKSRAVARYSAVVWTSSIGSALFTQGDRLLVGSMLGLPSLAVYGAITNITAQINVLSALPSQVLVPLLATHEGHGPDVSGEVRATTALTAAIAIGSGLVLIGLSSIAQGRLFDVAPRYISAFTLAVAIYAIYSLNAPGFYLLLGLGRPSVNTLLNGGGGALVLILILLVGRNGLLWAIGANAGYLVTLIANDVAFPAIGFKRHAWSKMLGVPVAIFGVVIFAAETGFGGTQLRLAATAIGLCLIALWMSKNGWSATELHRLFGGAE